MCLPHGAIVLCKKSVSEKRSTYSDWEGPWQPQESVASHPLLIWWSLIFQVTGKNVAFVYACVLLVLLLFFSSAWFYSRFLPVKKEFCGGSESAFL